MGKVNSWEETLAVTDREYAEVEIGDATFRLGTLSAAEMMKWAADEDDPEKSKVNGLALVAMCLVNDQGERIGKLDEMVKLRDRLSRKSVKALIKTAIDLNGLNATVEEKNASSAATPAAAPIASQETPAA